MGEWGKHEGIMVILPPYLIITKLEYFGHRFGSFLTWHLNLTHLKNDKSLSTLSPSLLPSWYWLEHSSEEPSLGKTLGGDPHASQLGEDTLALPALQHVAQKYLQASLLLAQVSLEIDWHCLWGRLGQRVDTQSNVSQQGDKGRWMANRDPPTKHDDSLAQGSGENLVDRPTA